METETETTVGLEQTETSLLRQLFSCDAAEVHGTITAAATPVDDRDFNAVLRHGLGRSTVEIEAMTEALQDGFALKTAVDARGLGALYRLSALMRLLGWPILTSLPLIERITEMSGADFPLYHALTARNETAEETDRLCSAIDWLVTLSRWMEDAGLASDTLLALLTPAEIGTLQASQADRDWLESLAFSRAPTLVNAETFRDHEIWEDRDGKRVQVPGETWNAQLSGESGLYGASGIFNPDKDPEVIDAACRTYIDTTYAVDFDNEVNETQLAQLVTRLEKRRDT
ncbi:hypothetical protein [Breoghania sp.]|uniref:hypothetical protein n=1 Tax=Breoghania sp. TaxID=2065378 RepID=UPI002623EBEC|nr:hypothetical protein [Breoghania sp.]MDJ0933684.1 hypothetical protein [Breoghania sp.]